MKRKQTKKSPRLRDGWFLSESNLNAAKDKIAMQAEALKEARRLVDDGSGPLNAILSLVDAAISASAESVAAWKSEHAAKVLEEAADRNKYKREKRLGEPVWIASIHLKAAKETGQCECFVYGDNEHLMHVEPLYPLATPEERKE